MQQSYLHNIAFLTIWIIFKLDQQNDEIHRITKAMCGKARALTSTQYVAPWLEVTLNQRFQERNFSPKNSFKKILQM